MIIKVIKFLIAALSLVLVVDPGDLIFHLKVPLFVLIFIMWFVLKSNYPLKIYNDIVFVCLLFLMIPFLGISSAMLQNNLSDVPFALGFIKSFIMIVLLIIIVDLDIEMQRYLIRYSIMIPLIIIPVYVFITINPASIVPIYNYLGAKDVAKFSRRNFYGYELIMLYYRTSPLLVFPLAYYVNNFLKDKRRLLNLLLMSMFFFTLILSGTRANILTAVVVVACLLFIHLLKKRNKLPLYGMLIIVTTAIAMFVSTLSFKQADESSQVKAGHFDSYIKLFEQSPQYLVWGAGLGSKFYSSGNKAFVSQTELTYIDLVRWFGFPLTFILLFLLAYPIIYLSMNRQINTENRYLLVAYIAYLFIAGTNPLLVSSTGMLAIITMYSLIKVKRKLITVSK